MDDDGFNRDSLPIIDRERDHDNNDTIKIFRPLVQFEIQNGRSNDEVVIRFDHRQMENYYGMFIIYYPGFIMARYLTDDDVSRNVRCRVVMDVETSIGDLLPSTIYTFCAILRDQVEISPFQCKSNQSQADREPWLYEEQKVRIKFSIIF